MRGRGSLASLTFAAGLLTLSSFSCEINGKRLIDIYDIKIYLLLVNVVECYPSHPSVDSMIFNIG